MPVIRDTLREATRKLHSDDAAREAEILLAHALRKSRAWLIAHAGDALDDVSLTGFQSLIARRVAGEPVAYLVGSRGFHALDLHVTPDVLIPRPETELLVELALQRIPSEDECTVADLGTGSGAIALAIAYARPRTRVVATDASAGALAVARDNAQRLRLRNVTFVEGDWYAPLGESRFDMIVSNPPYIAEGDAHMREGDLRFEPAMALVSGTDGLDAIRVLVRDAPTHLRDDGWLLFEHGFDQGPAARDLLMARGYAEVFTERDLEDRERVSGGHGVRSGV